MTAKFTNKPKRMPQEFPDEPPPGNWQHRINTHQQTNQKKKSQVMSPTTITVVRYVYLTLSI